MKLSATILSITIILINIINAQTYSHLAAWHYGVTIKANENGYFDGVELYTNAPNPESFEIWFYGPFNDSSDCSNLINGFGSNALNSSPSLINHETINSSNFSYSLTSQNNYTNNVYGLNYIQEDPNILVSYENGLSKMKLTKDKYYLIFFSISNLNYVNNEYRVTRIVNSSTFKNLKLSWNDFANTRKALAEDYDKLVNETQKTKLTICHNTPGNSIKSQTLEINSNAWPAHEAHGDVAGSCPIEFSSVGLTEIISTFYLSETAPYQKAVEFPLDINIKVEYTNKWRGNSNSDWNDPNNWSRNLLPESQNTIVLESGYTIPKITDSLSLDILVVEDGAEIDIDSNNFIKVTDYLLNTGKINGKVKLKGSHNQISAEGEIAELDIDNIAGATLTGKTDINKSLVLSNGSLETGGNELVLKSTETSTAILVNKSGEINGEITVEQYVPEPVYGHHYLSSPIKNTTFSQLSDDFGLALGASFPHLYYYDEPSASWLSPISENDFLIDAKGYTGYFVGDRIIDITGTPNNGDISINISNNGNGWNYIGNPYPSPIDWDLIELPSTVSPAVYVWDHQPEIWGVYATYLDGISINSGSNIIPMMQSFFVYTESDTSFNFTNSCRIEDPNIKGRFFKTNNNHPLVRLYMSGQGFGTECVIRLKDGATFNYDFELDAKLLPNGNPNGIDFSSISDDNFNLVINSLPDYISNDQIHLHTLIGTPELYTIDLTEFNNFPANTDVILHDSKLNLSHNLKNGAYSFYGDNLDVNRFYITLEDFSVQIEPTNNNYMTVFSSNNSIYINFNTYLQYDVSINIYNVLGQKILSKTLRKGVEKHQIYNQNLKSNNIYILEFLSKTIHYTDKIYLKN